MAGDLEHGQRHSDARGRIAATRRRTRGTRRPLAGQVCREMKIAALHSAPLDRRVEVRAVAGRLQSTSIAVRDCTRAMIGKVVARDVAAPLIARRRPVNRCRQVLAHRQDRSHRRHDAGSALTLINHSSCVRTDAQRVRSIRAGAG